MVKKRNSVALFEVISKSKEKSSQADMGVPAWMGGTAQDEDAPKPDSPVPAAPKLPPLPAPPVRTAPLMTTAGGRLQLSLNYVSCLVIAVGLVLLLAGAFWLGRKTAPAPQTGEGRMKAEFRAGLLSENDTAGAGAAKTLPKRIPGKYYIVIESTRGTDAWHLAQAEKIARFCIERNEPAEVRKYPATSRSREQYVAWSLTPFDSPTSEAATQHARGIEKLGEEFFELHGDYKFLQRNAGRFDPWFLKAH